MVRVTSSATAPSIARIWIGAMSKDEPTTIAAEHREHQRRAAALERLLGGLVEIDEVDVGGEAADVVGRALEQQRVADPHHHVVELAADVLVPPVHRQRIDAVAAPQPEAAERAADQPAVGQDQRLDGGRALASRPGRAASPC